MLRIVALAFFLCIFLSGCSTVKLAEVNDCGAWTFGMVTPSQYDTQYKNDGAHLGKIQRCLKGKYAQGFSEFDLEWTANLVHRSDDKRYPRKPIRAKEARVNADIATAMSQPLKKVNWSESKYSLEFNTQADWERKLSPISSYQMYAISPSLNAGMFVSLYDANPFIIWSDARDSMQYRLSEEMKYYDKSKINEIKIQGVYAFQMELRGRDKNDVPLHFLITQIKFPRSTMYLTTWCFQEDFEKNKAEFYRVAESMVVQIKGVD
jgi:hypothetical protein